jgi:hypothetical protein
MANLLSCLKPDDKDKMIGNTSNNTDSDEDVSEMVERR